MIVTGSLDSEMMHKITIGFLADYPDTVSTLAKWFRAQWPDYFADMTLAEMEQDFLEDASYDRLPLRLVAFAAGELAGTVVLREPGNEAIAEFQPELGGLFVVATCRGQGIGTELVRAGMNLARDLGYARVFATTVTAVGILESLGWEFIKTVRYEDGPQRLYGRKL